VFDAPGRFQSGFNPFIRRRLAQVFVAIGITAENIVS